MLEIYLQLNESIKPVNISGLRFVNGVGDDILRSVKGCHLILTSAVIAIKTHSQRKQVPVPLTKANSEGTSPGLTSLPSPQTLSPTTLKK